MATKKYFSNKPLAKDCIHFHPCMRVFKASRDQTGRTFTLFCDSEGGCQCYKKQDPSTLEAERKQRREDYYQSLETPEFQELQMQVFKRDNYQCQRCGTAKNLVTHHLTYERRGHEKLSDLVTLCKECHKIVHGNDFDNNITEEE